MGESSQIKSNLQKQIEKSYRKRNIQMMAASAFDLLLAIRYLVESCKREHIQDDFTKVIIVATLLILKCMIDCYIHFLFKKLYPFDFFLTDCIIVFYILYCSELIINAVNQQRKIIDNADFVKQLESSKPDIFKDYLDLIPSGITIVSQDQQILYQNERIQNQFYTTENTNLIKLFQQMRVIEYDFEQHFQLMEQKDQPLPQFQGHVESMQKNNSGENQLILAGPSSFLHSQQQAFQNVTDNFIHSCTSLDVDVGFVIKQILEMDLLQQQPSAAKQKDSLHYLEQDEILQQSDKQQQYKQNSTQQQKIEQQQIQNGANNSNISQQSVMNYQQEILVNQMRQVELQRFTNDNTEENFFHIMIKAKLGNNNYLIQLTKMKANFKQTDNPNNLKKQPIIIVVIQDINYIAEIEQLKQEKLQQQQILSQTAHEFRTPLNCSILMLEKLMSIMQIQNATIVDQFLRPTLHSQKLLLSLINDILDLSQINGGKITFIFQKFNLRKLIAHVIQLMTIQAEIKNIKLVTEIDNNVPKKFISDPNRLRQIIINLVGNALKFTKQGSIKIKVEQYVNNASDNFVNTLQISVIDTGIGIKKDQLDKLFRCFGRIENKENKKLNSQGVGLGLVISHMLSLRLGPAEQSGIKVESEYGQGSTFKFLLIQQEDEIEQLQQQQSEQILESDLDSSNQNFMEKQASTIQNVHQQPNTFQQNQMNSYFENDQQNGNIQNCQLDQMIKSQNDVESQSKYSIKSSNQFQIIQKPPTLKTIETSELKFMDGKDCCCSKILVVDDNQFNILVFKQIFQEMLPKIEAAYSGEEALEKIQLRYQQSNCCKHHLLIFMDIDMPGMNGYQACQEIIKFFQENKLSKYFIIGCSGYQNEKEKDKAEKAGMKYYLQKPIDLKTMKKLLKTIYKEFMD